MGRGLLLALLLGAVGCQCRGDGQCREGAGSCPCGPGERCDQGLYCAEGGCVTCAPGVRGCPCFAASTCHEQLTCVDGQCEACKAGAQGCACWGAGLCGEGLACVAERCVLAGCVPGSEACGCEAGGCAEGLYCGDGVCHRCSNSRLGCPCSGGVCAGLVCEAGICRGVKRCDGLCREHQICDGGRGGRDAVCLETCEKGHVWVAATQTCEVSTCALRHPEAQAICPGREVGQGLAEPCLVVCGEILGSESSVLSSKAEGLRLRGEVPSLPLTADPLTNTESGFQLLPGDE